MSISHKLRRKGCQGRLEEKTVTGIKLQTWETWIFYPTLVDLGDAVADELSLPLDSISLEMIYRGM